MSEERVEHELEVEKGPRLRSEEDKASSGVHPALQDAGCRHKSPGRLSTR